MKSESLLLTKELGKTIIRSPKLISKTLLHTGKVKINYRDTFFSPNSLLYINPNDIKYRIIPFFKRFVPSDRFTYVATGDWDKRYADKNKVYPQDYLNSGRESRYGDNKKLFPREFPQKMTLVSIEQFDQYISYKNHFNNNVPWEDTLFYQRRIDEGFKTSRYDSAEGLLRRLEFIDELYQEMKSEGYKSQQQLRAEGGSRARGWHHEIQIDFSREGYPILDDGRNRLFIAKLLDIDRIPVRVLVRHEKWQNIRKHLINTSDDSNPEWKNKYLPHPDLKNLSSPTE